MKRILIVTTVLVCISLGILVVSATSPAAADVEETEEIDVDEEGVNEPYTLEELRDEGTRYSGAPDSVRIEDETSYWVIHWPASALLADVGDPESSGWEYLSPDETVDRNSVWLRSINTGSSETVDVNVVYYDVETREMANGTEQVATNFAVDQHRVELEQGWPMAEIPLRQSDDKRFVTMWIEGSDEAKWTFQHESVATTAPAGIDSEQDYLVRALMEFFAPLVVGSFGAGFVVKRTLGRTGTGPMKGMAVWLIALSIITTIFVMTQFNTLAELLVMLPEIIAVFMVAVIAIVILESYRPNVRRVKFIQPELEDVSSPSGEEMFGFQSAETREEYVVEMDNGDLALIRPGIIPFLSRVFGGAAVVDKNDLLKTRTKVDGAREDEWVFVDPDAEDVLDYKPEGWQLELPEPETSGEWMNLGAVAAIIALVGIGIAQHFNASWGAGAAAMLAIGWMAKPEMGRADFVPAPGHLRAAYVSAMYLNIEYDRAKTMEKANERIIQLEASREREKAKALEDQDSTLIESMHGDKMQRNFETAKPDTNGTGSTPSDDPSPTDESSGRTEATDGESSDRDYGSNLPALVEGDD